MPSLTIITSHVSTILEIMHFGIAKNKTKSSTQTAYLEKPIARLTIQINWHCASGERNVLGKVPTLQAFVEDFYVPI